MIDRRLLRDFDWVMFGLTMALTSVGALGVYSATHSLAGVSNLYYDHLGRIGVGLLVMLLLTFVDYNFILQYAYHLYAISLVGLVAVELIGVVGMGAQRWLSFGFMNIQPSEFFKLALVLAFARYFGGLRKPSPFTFADVWPIVVAALLPFLLVLKQPDLGTAMIIAGICLGMLFIAGLELRLFIWSGGAALAGAGLLSALHALGVINILAFFREYQVRRLKVLFNPNLDPLGAGYHINQSKIAIGSGGVTGKGFLHGTQSSLDFLPQQHTDFIFSVMSEEWGFIGAVAIIAIMLFMVLWAVQTAYNSKDFSGSLIVMGVATVFFLHCSINIGMTLGIIPVVGLPLPLLSYGGSSVLTTSAGIGLIMNVKMRRYLYG